MADQEEEKETQNTMLFLYSLNPVHPELEIKDIHKTLNDTEFR